MIAFTFFEKFERRESFVCVAADLGQVDLFLWRVSLSLWISIDDRGIQPRIFIAKSPLSHSLSLSLSRRRRSVCCLRSRFTSKAVCLYEAFPRSSFLIHSKQKVLVRFLIRSLLLRDLLIWFFSLFLVKNTRSAKEWKKVFFCNGRRIKKHN